MLKIIWDFEIETDHLISTWRPDVEIVNIKKRKEKEKETMLNSGFCHPGGPQIENQRKRKER